MMAEGTISMADGLGIKALDSNEVRRRQGIHLDSTQTTQIHFPISSNPKSSTSGELGIPHQYFTNESHSGSTLQVSVPISSLNGFEAHIPKSPKKSSLARKLQQVFFEESLKMEVEERGALVQSNTS